MSLIPLLYLIPGALVLLLLVASGGEKLPPGEEGKEPGRFTRAGWYLGKKTAFFNRKDAGMLVSANLALLKPRRDPETSKRLYYAEKIGLLLLLILAGSLLAALVSWSSRQDHVVEDGRIRRHGYGDAAREESLVLTAQDGTVLSEEMPVSVSARQYTRAQADQLFQRALTVLPGVMRSDNASLDEVRTDLVLPDHLDGYPFEISWKIGNYSLIHSDGQIQTENVPPEGEVVTLTAQFAYLDMNWEQEIPIRILPPRYTKKELWEQGMEQLLEQADQASVHEDYMALPTQIGGRTYTWAGKVRDDAGLLFLMVLAAAAAVFVMKDKDLEKQAAERADELIRDYPGFVSKLTLYLGAGMTVRNVFLKLASDYAVKRERGELRFLGEELSRAVNELESGVSEGTVYEHFSLRCRSQPYTRLCTLLTQNLRKGNGALLPLLREESRKALNERMDHARKRGEEAGTKLLLPMMLMMVIVMVVIMIPAFLSI
ncbi:MAG: type II secretion system F family protein [Lachnospiraceae bacterium]|nr:type II secretion system F family protein [Lachnospiraceae bacterium]